MWRLVVPRGVWFLPLLLLRIGQCVDTSEEVLRRLRRSSLTPFDMEDGSHQTTTMNRRLQSQIVPLSTGIVVKKLMKKERDEEAPSSTKKKLSKKQKANVTIPSVGKGAKGSKSEKVKDDTSEKNNSGKGSGNEPNKGKGKDNVFDRTEAPFPSPGKETIRPAPAASITFAPYNSLSPTKTPQRTPVTTAAPQVPRNITFAPIPPTSVNTTSAPTAASSEQRVLVPAYYIAFAAAMADREPTDEEYLLITQLTTMYFEAVFVALYNADPVIFERVDSVLIEDQYIATSTPDVPYNIYMTFNTTVVFTGNSTALPSGDELLDIMDGAIGASYIVNYVWQATDTPFISTNDVSLNAVPETQSFVAVQQIEAAKAKSRDNVLPNGISSQEFRLVNDP